VLATFTDKPLALQSTKLAAQPDVTAVCATTSGGSFPSEVVVASLPAAAKRVKAKFVKSLLDCDWDRDVICSEMYVNKTANSVTYTLDGDDYGETYEVEEQQLRGAITPAGAPLLSAAARRALAVVLKGDCVILDTNERLRHTKASSHVYVLQSASEEECEMCSGSCQSFLHGVYRSRRDANAAALREVQDYFAEAGIRMPRNRAYSDDFCSISYDAKGCATVAVDYECGEPTAPCTVLRRRLKQLKEENRAAAAIPPTAWVATAPSCS
jgi:hypothetical protein